MKKFVYGAIFGWTWALVNIYLFVMTDEDLMNAYMKKFNKYIKK